MLRSLCSAALMVAVLLGVSELSHAAGKQYQEPQGLQQRAEATMVKLGSRDLGHSIGGPSGAIKVQSTAIAPSQGHRIGGEVHDIGGLVRDLGGRITPEKKIILHLAADIMFGFDKSDVNPAMNRTLRKVSTLIHKTQSKRVLIEGFTDNKGGSLYNLKLSKRRAESVKLWLVQRGRVHPNILQTYGMGPSRPVALEVNPDGSDSPAGRAKNRRVVITIDPK